MNIHDSFIAEWGAYICVVCIAALAHVCIITVTDAVVFMYTQ